MTRLRFAASLLALASLCLSGCPLIGGATPDAEPAPPQGNLPATSTEPGDLNQMRDKLAGAWVVRRAGRVVLEYNLDGDHIEVIDRRYPTPRELRGEFRVRSTSGFGVQVEDGTTYWYSAAWVGSDVHIGLGAAIEVPNIERFTAQLGAWERLERTPETCVYVRTWGGNETRADVPCEVTERSGRQVFSYESEDPFRPDRLKKVELDVVGNYLMDRELAESLAVPRVIYEREQAAPTDGAPAEIPAPGTAEQPEIPPASAGER
ncbi:MAG: hypothetical protein R3F39_17630 [Myxococcota bacterium]